MSSLGDRIYDEGLNRFNDEATHIHVCSAEPATFADVATYTLGNKTPISIPIASDRSGGGREVIVPEVTDGSVTGTGTVTHYAIIDNVNSRLLATQTVSVAKPVITGNIWVSESFTIGMPDPA